MQDNEISGQVTTIQRFSLHDGPGIRTTVFLQGCNMACAWCHNPETITLTPVLQYDATRCIGCLHCVNTCSTGAHGFEHGCHVFDRSKCTGCAACAAVCFHEALEMSGRAMTVAAVMEEIMADEDYYRNSGGGVTLSGGESTLQPEFVRALLRACRARGLHTAIESNLLVSWERLRSLMELTDLLMFDVKLLDSEKHRKWTGAPNEVILANVAKLAALGLPVIVRTPIIPGVNDEESVITEISELVSRLPALQYYELLPYNPLAESKYSRLGKSYAMPATRAVAPDRMANLRTVAAATSITVR